MHDEKSLSQASKKGPIEEKIEMIRSQRHQASSSSQAPNPQLSVASTSGVSASASSSPPWWQNWMRKIIRGIPGILFSGELLINIFANWLTSNTIWGPGTPLGTLLTFRQYILCGLSCLFLVIIVLWWQPSELQNRRRWWPRNRDWRLFFIICLVLVITILVTMLWISPENISVSFTPAIKNISKNIPIEASSGPSSGSQLSIPIYSYPLSQSYVPISTLATNESCSINVLGVKIRCQTSVSKVDVDKAIEVMQAKLEAAMSSQLYQQTGRTVVSGINFTQIAPSNVKSSVKIGDVVNSSDKKFTVTIAQKQVGTVQYVDNSDIENAVSKYLNDEANSQKECPGGYERLQHTLQISSPIVPRIDLSQPVVNELTFYVTGSATFFCRFGPDQLNVILNNLVGKSFKDAHKYLESLSGIDHSHDDDATIDFLSGNGSNLPVDPAHIQIEIKSLPQTYSLPISPGS